VRSGARWRFFVSEALRSLKNNFATTLAATVTVFIVLCVLGLGAALGSYIFNYTENVKSDVTIKVWLADSATDAQRNDILLKLQADQRVKSVQYKSAEQALADARKKNPDYVALLNGNPFPAGFFVKAKHSTDVSRIAASVRGLPGLDASTDSSPNPDYGAKISDRVLSTASVIETVILVVAVVLGIAAVLLIGNTIRLSIYARRREVEVMKLVGATNWFVRWPFMLEGMLCGAIGAVLAVIVMLIGYWRVHGWFVGSTLNGQTTSGISMWALGAILVVGGIALGAAGSGLTMRRFLRV
jgi:cell division transport system permease protein